MDYLLDDLIDYTMEKVAAEEEEDWNADPKSRYNAEIKKAQKRQKLGKKLLIGGSLAAIPASLAINNLNRVFTQDPDSQSSYFDKARRFDKSEVVGSGLALGSVAPAAAGAGMIAHSMYKKRRAKKDYRDALLFDALKEVGRNKSTEKTALLNDLIDYTMEKVAAEELDGRERYEQEMGKARKRQIAGRVLTGTGLGVGVANIGMFGRDAMKIGKQYGTDLISQMNPEYQAAAMAAGKKFYKRGLAWHGVFAAGLGTGAYNKAKKRKA